MNRISHLLLGSIALAAMSSVCFAPETGTGAAETLSEPAPQHKHGEPISGATGKVAMVHKKDCEGALLIDAITGYVLPEQHDRPEWSDGLSLAQFSERHQFYTARLGNELYTAEMKNPELYAYEDLSWLGVNTDADSEEAGNEVSIDADSEHRMEVLAAVLGIDREIEGEGAVEGAYAEIEISRDYHRSGAEMAAFTEAQQNKSFEEDVRANKTGTEG